ncbi:hypothetical protein RhiirA5_444619, partial [Rhizophagus irregularis]
DIIFQKREGSPHELPNICNFPSNLLFNAPENYKQENLPLDAKDIMYTGYYNFKQA